LNLQNKTIVVTGAASGIGAECARTLEAAGASVIAVDRNTPARQHAQFIQADLSEPLSISRLVASLPDRIDGLCNIAGLPPTKGALPVIQVNFLGVRLLTELLADGKLADGAAIVNLASMAAVDWPANLGQVKRLLALDDFSATAAFCANEDIGNARSYFLSKEALVVWTMQQRWAWRARGIRMNAVSPGPVETPIHQDFLDTLGKRAEEDMLLLERAARPADIAPLVAFLCSDDSAWIRGVNIACDGGLHSHVQEQQHGFGRPATDLSGRQP
jgi:NAD(P)-dependent dehydrogenase (short-subunit alcohol dehydrogenase family)